MAFKTRPSSAGMSADLYYNPAASGPLPQGDQGRSAQLSEWRQMLEDIKVRGKDGILQSYPGVITLRIDLAGALRIAAGDRYI